MNQVLSGSLAAYSTGGKMGRFLRAVVVITALLISPSFSIRGILYSQELSSTKGGVSGTITDNSGAVIPGATVTVLGQVDTRTVTTDGGGQYTITNLTPGQYTIKVEKENFKTAETKGVDIVINRVSTLNLKLDPGAASETVEVSANTLEVDTTSTALSTNLNDTFYQQVPVARNVGSLFYAAPGVVGSGGTGTANPAIGGATGLENQYVADGVDIGDAGYGGLGVFSPTYGSLGTGINLTFIQEVQVKTGAFEPKYGRANGGLIQIVTKSGSNKFHGALGAYFAPDAFQATNYYADNFGRVNVHGKAFSQPQFDTSIEFGGYVPGNYVKDHLFFFGAYNPALNQIGWIAPPSAGLFAHGPFTNSTTINSWAAKVTYKPTDEISLDASFFGDPSRTNAGLGLDNEDTFPFYPQNFVEDTSGFSRWNYGSRSETVRLTNALSPTWELDIAANAKQSHFTETPLSPNTYQVADYVGNDVSAALPSFNLLGLGYIQNPNTHTYGISLDTQKTVSAFGSHTFSMGWGFERSIYDLYKTYSGPIFNFPANNAAGTAITSVGGTPQLPGALASAGFNLRAVTDNSCPTSLCPVYNDPVAGPQQVYLQQTRGLFGGTGNQNDFSSLGYHAIYGNDDWQINRFVTINAGIRWEEEQLNGVVQQYVFTDNWSPRLGINIDPFGDRKSKVFFNFGRYTQSLPADAAIRELNQELDIYKANWKPEIINGAITPVLDAAHLLSGDADAGSTVGSRISASGSAYNELIAPKTKLNYEEEYVLGVERQLKGFVISARYTDRRLLRIIEDLSGASPEGSINGYVAQNFVIGNPSSAADYFVNEVEQPYTYNANAPNHGAPANCPFDYNVYDDQGDSAPITDAFGNVARPGGACGFNADVAGNPVPDGIADGFANPRRHYQAFEVEVNKNFSHNYLFRANYRFAKLNGNYEGLFRNDNGQSDPGVSSLYDFTEGKLGLLGAQFAIGPLNEDRRNVANLFGSYLVSRSPLKNLTIGAGLRGQSGTPISELAAHPVYQNAGEVPIGGRGSEGRTPSNLQLDLHTDYPISVRERYKVKLAWDMFNITDSRPVLYKTEDVQTTYGVQNADFLKPEAFQRAFYARGSIRFEF
jgi:carboxypeptidase family protein